MDSGEPVAIVPAATYRLQFNKDFGFRAAADLVPYLADLGFSHIHASPYLKARPGSLHGYDITDYTVLNPEVGSDEEFRQYLDVLQQHAVSQVLDIVPNHMCVECRDNRWWQDLLENGVSSLYADHFDINWEPVKRELTNKVLLPVLGAQFGRILENRELHLVYHEAGFWIEYYDHRFPLSPVSFPDILSFRSAELDPLLVGEQEALEEYQSVVTSFARLPVDTERDPALVAERYREKEVAKRRLWKLYCDSRIIREFIDRNVEIFNGMEGEPSSFDLLEKLLLRQSYRVAHWRVATEEINYRRFFDINALGAIRIERTPVFEEVHRLVLDLLGSGHVTGFRVDHSDGLYNPVKYFHQLQAASYQRLRSGGELHEETPPDYQDLLATSPAYKPCYVVAEKILLGEERVPEEWPIHGETGYSFINSLNHLMIDPAGFESFDDLYRSFTGIQMQFHDFLYEKKKLIMYSSMSSEINTLGFHLSGVASNNRHTWDFTLNSLIKALVEVIAYFPVYRTYTNSLGVAETDRERVRHAVALARRQSKGIDPSVFDFVQDVLTLSFFVDMPNDQKQQWLDFVMRFQQITGPVMAKGMEDTTFYIYNRLISLNEVGGNPEVFGLSLENFHQENLERQAAHPHGMLTASTHDTKRGEDVRARINVLTEVPDEWTGAVSRWGKTNRRHKKLVDNDLIPNPNKEYHLYQTLVGAWPFDSEDPDEFARFVVRIKNYMQKALREAKENTSWINPNESYEQGVLSFIDEILSDRTFLDDIKLFLKPVALCAMYASLSMTLLKMTCPGVPDFYQGSELWDLRLVDPDNRQPVDYERRRSLLNGVRRMAGEELRQAAQLLAESPEDGRVKLFLVYRVLGWRREHGGLFTNGSYRPLGTTGGRTEEVCAFARASGEEEMIVVAPRFFSRLTGNGKRRPVGDVVWGDCFLVLPEATGRRYRNILTHETHEVKGDLLPLAEVLNVFPVALLARVT